MYEKFEIVSGNLNSQNTLVQRYNREFPNLDPNCVFGLVRRYSFLDLWPCTNDEIASFEGGHCGRLFEEAQGMLRLDLTEFCQLKRPRTASNNKESLSKRQPEEFSETNM